MGVDTVVKGQEAIASTLGIPFIYFSIKLTVLIDRFNNKGPLGLTVDDVVLALKVVENENMWAKDPKVPPVPFNDETYQSKTQLRIGYYVNDLYFTPHYASVRAVNKAVEALKSQGHTLVPISPPPNIDQVVSLYISFITADGMRQISDYMKGELSGPAAKRTSTLCRLPFWLKHVFGFLLRCFGQYRLALQLTSMGPIDPFRVCFSNNYQTAYYC